MFSVRTVRGPLSAMGKPHRLHAGRFIQVFRGGRRQSPYSLFVTYQRLCN